jgi:hypothetical protein
MELDVHDANFRKDGFIFRNHSRNSRLFHGYRARGATYPVIGAAVAEWPPICGFDLDLR